MANILLVDDNEDILELGAFFLRRAGHAVTLAANGVEAMQLVEGHNFDLIITDLLMPEKEGIEVIMELRQKKPALKIIAMSGGGRNLPNDYLVIAKKMGVAKTLSKPFLGTDLVEAVAGVLAS